ncbi:hypothetical protein HMPREF0868_0996 [Mageeibacillus indolicus UPII9-5]|uniref:Uncharacterized protein n=1 Tax=Mageeibacillus indolicus (strain UPII9-5) TaxID=699246 RepID=D3R290_MAGIU|nr:hypothetical protein HMPREF0868_0996 [Mageeibacillus indolicus UPII9-5]
MLGCSLEKFFDKRCQMANVQYLIPLFFAYVSRRIINAK